MPLVSSFGRIRGSRLTILVNIAAYALAVMFITQQFATETIHTTSKRNDDVSMDVVITVDQPDVEATSRSLSTLTSLDFLQDYDDVNTIELCEETWDLEALRGFEKAKVNYCSSDSLSQITCYYQTVGTGKDGDVFCVLEGHIQYTGSKRFNILGCDLVKDASPNLSSLKTFMYETGLGNIMPLMTIVSKNDYQIQKEQYKSAKIDETPTILCKRDGETNLVHFLNELFAYFQTAYILDIPRGDLQNQVMFVDDRQRGPYWDLWNIYARKGAKMWNEIESSTTFRKVIMALPGGSGPLWKGDWKSFPCVNSNLLRKLRDDVIEYLQLKSVAAPQAKETVITFISRKEKRILLNEEDVFARLEGKWKEWVPSDHKVKIQRVDFATMPFAEQVKVVRGSNILMGVHGAGLNHLLWLPSEAVVIEVMPPRFETGLFRNQAKMLGLLYMSVGSLDDNTNDGYSFINVKVDETKALELLKVAIAVTLNFGSTMERTIA